MYLQHMLLKIRMNTFLESIMSIVFTSFKHPKLPISIKIHVTLLQIVYILKDFENASPRLNPLFHRP